MDIQNGNKPHLDTDFREWIKSPLSNPDGNQCVELSFTSNAVGMRDSQNPDGAVLVFDNDEWNAFASAVESGFFQRR
jgi:hypothetical protein